MKIWQAKCTAAVVSGTKSSKSIHCTHSSKTKASDLIKKTFDYQCLFPLIYFHYSHSVTASSVSVSLLVLSSLQMLTAWRRRRQQQQQQQSTVTERNSTLTLQVHLNWSRQRPADEFCRGRLGFLRRPLLGGVSHRELSSAMLPVVTVLRESSYHTTHTSHHINQMVWLNTSRYNLLSFDVTAWFKIWLSEFGSLCIKFKC